MRHKCVKRSKCRERSLLLTHKKKATEREKLITAKRMEFQLNARKKQENMSPEPPKKGDKDQDGPFRSFKRLDLGQHSKSRVLC